MVFYLSIWALIHLDSFLCRKARYPLLKSRYTYGAFATWRMSLGECSGCTLWRSCPCLSSMTVRFHMTQGCCWTWQKNMTIICVYTIRINRFIFKWSRSLPSQTSQPWQNATLPSFSLLVFPSRSHCSTSQINLHFPSFNVFIWLVTRRFFINKLYLVCSLPLNIPILEYSPSICYSFYFTYPYTHQELINEVNTSCSTCACNNIPSSTCLKAVHTYYLQTGALNGLSFGEQGPR